MMLARVFAAAAVRTGMMLGFAGPATADQGYPLYCEPEGLRRCF